MPLAGINNVNNESADNRARTARMNYNLLALITKVTSRSCEAFSDPATTAIG